MSKGCKCDTCLNSHVAISENGVHTACTLSPVKATECLVDMKDNYMTCDKVGLFPSEYQEIENAIDRVVDDIALVMDTTEIVDLRAKYQSLVAGKVKNDKDVDETYTPGQIELLQQILDIFDGVGEPENEL